MSPKLISATPLRSTVEVFQSFGFAERLVKEGAHINEVAHWEPKESGGIHRTKRTPDNEPGTSRFPHAVLTQGRIERFMLDAMKEFGEPCTLCCAIGSCSLSSGFRRQSRGGAVNPTYRTPRRAFSRFGLLLSRYHCHSAPPQRGGSYAHSGRHSCEWPVPF